MKRTSTEKRIISGIRASYRRVSGRMTTLLKHNEVVSPALEVFKRSSLYDPKTNTIKNISVKDLSIKELRTLRDELFYIDSLKTSRLSYAKDFTNTNASLMESIHRLPKEVEDRFWDIYQKFGEMNRGVYEVVKYDALGEIFANLDKMSDEDLVKQINFLYGQWSETEEVFTSQVSHIDYTIPTNK